MRIIHIIYSLTSGGAEKITSLLANAQSQRGHEVCVLQLTGEGTPGALFHRDHLLPMVHYISAHMDSGVSPMAAFRVGRAIREWKPDIIHMHSNALPYLWLRLIAETLPGVRRLPALVWTLHNMPSRATGGRVQCLLDSIWLRSGRVVPVTLSTTCAREYEQIYGRTPNIVPNGLPPVSQSAGVDEVKRMVESLRHTDNTRVFIHAARFHTNKRPDRLLEAFRRLEAEGADYVLLVIGAGWDSPEAHTLLANAPEGVRIIGEVTNPGDYIMASDALCLSSDYEGMPLCIIEALSCGVTPVCTPAGGIVDMITDGETGYLSSDFSAAGFYDALRRFLDSPIDSSRLVALYSERYTLRRCMEDYIRVYEEALQERKS